jgi:hypothetical protein
MATTRPGVHQPSPILQATAAPASLRTSVSRRWHFGPAEVIVRRGNRRAASRVPEVAFQREANGLRSLHDAFARNTNQMPYDFVLRVPAPKAVVASRLGAWIASQLPPFTLWRRDPGFVGRFDGSVFTLTSRHLLFERLALVEGQLTPGEETSTDVSVRVRNTELTLGLVIGLVAIAFAILIFVRPGLLAGSVLLAAAAVPVTLAVLLPRIEGPRVERIMRKALSETFPVA